VPLLSIHLHSCQGGPPPSTLSSRPKRSAVEGSAVYVHGETEPGGDSPTPHSLCPKAELQVPPRRYPGFPVEFGGVGELHAAFFTESRTRGRWSVPRSRKPGYDSVPRQAGAGGMTKWSAVAHLGICGGGWTESAQQQPTYPVSFAPFSSKHSAS
jgi:hypothetical protein